jgi:uncharacterized membrane protein YpjA
MTRLWQFSEYWLRQLMQLINAIPAIFWLCMAVDFGGFLIGAIIWYGPQLAAAPWWAWLFIPDCPLAALYGMITFIRLRQGHAPDWLTALASLACIKYGFWTVIFWGTKWAATGEYLPLEIGLVIVHLAMAGQGLLLWPALMNVAKSVRFGAIAWLALSVYVDYGFGHYPALAYPITPDQAGMWAAGLTIVLAVAMALLSYRPLTATTARTA